MLLIALLAAIDTSPAHSALAQARKETVTQKQSQAETNVNRVWQLQQSGTTAGLRGIASVDATVAWASGTEGTVLKTTDGGAHWTKCAVPDGDKDGATLDFRAVQAWDATKAIVLASGPGDKSRIYRTEDGCKHWKLLFTNPEKDGFYDALVFLDRQYGMVLGDPVHNTDLRNAPPVEGAYDTFRMRVTDDGGTTWRPAVDPENGQPGKNLQPMKGESFFAASNSSMAVRGGVVWIGTSRNRVIRRSFSRGDFKSIFCAGAIDPYSYSCGIPWMNWISAKVPLGDGGTTSGIFSVAFRSAQQGVVAGGDYAKPAEPANTSAWSSDGGAHWTASARPPHGYRSSVQWSEALHLWIAAGSNGSDISRDDGRTWQPLDNGSWNALSLPFIVGAKGRIARLNSASLPPAK